MGTARKASDITLTNECCPDKGKLLTKPARETTERSWSDDGPHGTARVFRQPGIDRYLHFPMVFAQRVLFYEY